MKHLFLSLISLSLIFQISCCTKSADKDYSWAKNGIERATYQLRNSALKFSDSLTMPRSIKDGSYKLIDPYDWTSGFFPGNLWYAYELTGDTFFRDQAVAYTARLEPIATYKGTHDLGFMVYCSFGNELRLDGDTAKVAPIIVEAANSLSSRFNPQIGQIRSWDFGKWNYPVIIDNMMNLEMLFWASHYTGDQTYKNVAIKHADISMKNHFRPDNTSYHVVSYNNDGSVESQGTFQGFSDSSAWARGQAWGLYGYTVCFRETQDAKYLEQAQKIAKVIMENPNLTEDLIPYWDYNAPNIPDAPRDASAAAVTASALLELSTMITGDQSKSYYQYAETILKSLSSDQYLAANDTNGDFILMHSVGHLPADSEIDTPLNYADYYYLEALNRYLNMEGLDPKKL